MTAITKASALRVIRLAYGPDRAASLAGRLPDRIDLEVFHLDELGKITLAAHDDHRTVVVDDTAGMFAAVKDDALIAKKGAVIADDHVPGLARPSKKA